MERVEVKNMKAKEGDILKYQEKKSLQHRNTTQECLSGAQYLSEEALEVERESP